MSIRFEELYDKQIDAVAELGNRNIESLRFLLTEHKACYFALRCDFIDNLKKLAVDISGIKDWKSED